MGLMIFFSIPSGFLSGLMADRIRKDRLKWLLAGAFLFQALGITAFLASQTIAMVYVFLIFYGFGIGPHRPLLIVIKGRYFGRKAYGSIEGTSMMFQAPITLFAPVYVGWVYDRTGSYLSALMLFATLAALVSSPCTRYVGLVAGVNAFMQEKTTDVQNAADTAIDSAITATQ